MSDTPAGGADSNREAVFDIERIKQLIDLMRENELSEIDLHAAEHRIRLRSEKNAAPTYLTSGAPMMPAMPAPPVAEAGGAAAPAAAAEDEAHIDYVRSPMVGTFYAKPNPNSEPYVKVGDVIDASTTVCTVEAMKMFNEIPAGVSGKIVAVLAQNEEPVDVNKPLFKVDTRS